MDLKPSFWLPLIGAAAACSDNGLPGFANPPRQDAAVVAVDDASVVVPALGTSVNGIATYYAATGAGNCSFPASPGDLMVAAMDNDEYAGSAVCGECVRVDGRKGSVTVRIVDRCPGCSAGHLDLSKEAFAMIDDLAAGRVDITWQVAPCSVTGPVAYQFKHGSSQYWTAIQVRNHRLPIKRLSYLRDGAWVDFARANYNYFVESRGVGPGGFRVRVTSVDGQMLEDMLPAVQAEAVVQGSGQFE